MGKIRTNLTEVHGEQCTHRWELHAVASARRHIAWPEPALIRLFYEEAAGRHATKHDRQ